MHTFPVEAISSVVLTDLLHGAHVDDAVSLRGHAEDLIQDLLHVQLLTLGVVKAVHYGGTLHLQVLQHSAARGWRDTEGTAESHLKWPNGAIWDLAFV